MKKTKTKNFLSSFCVIDIETRGLSARPESFVFGCVYAENFQKTFFNREEMRDFLLSNVNPYKYIFAHNGEFDFTILFDNIILNLDNSALFVGSTFVQAKRNKKIFSNSLPILKSSVKALGKALGLEKMELAEKFKNGKGKIEVTQKDIDYCYRDCEIVFVFLKKIFTLTGKIKPTIASCSMEIFKKNYLVRPLKKNPLNELFRASYYGGRVECFRFGKIKPIYKYDVNSLYPYVCTKMFFPDFNKLRRGKNNSIDYFNSFILPNYEGSALVTVEHKRNFVGVLPFRRKTEIIFPYGIFTARYNFNELRFALRTGLVKIKVLKDYCYAPRICFTELREYMFNFFKAKNESEGAEKLINKFLLNALTGKFAQKEYGSKTYFTKTKDAFRFLNELPPKTKVILHHFSENRDDLFVEVFKSYKNKKINWNIPTISSYITSEARLKMLPFFLANKNNLVYTDTDSLVMTKPLDKKYISEDALGMFKKEHETEIEVIGNKHYQTKIDGKKVYHIKGVSKNFKRKGKYFSFNKMIRTKESINRNLHAGMFVEVVKHIAKDYTKRTVNNNLTLTLKINEQ